MAAKMHKKRITALFYQHLSKNQNNNFRASDTTTKQVGIFCLNYPLATS
jgi:hypothetical protein